MRISGGTCGESIGYGALSEFFVLPLNSPTYYAPYNGAIEESQRELKACLREELVPGLPCSPDPIAVYAEVA